MRLFSIVKSVFQVVVLLLVVSSVQASNGLEQMKRFLNGVTTLQANFEQTVFDQETQRVIDSSGVFSLKRPGQFRWDYTQPEAQQIVADGRQIWLYDPELEQVSVQSQDTALQGTPAMLLIAGDSVEKHFTVQDLGERDNTGWVELVPRSEESQFARILLAFSDDQLQSMEMVDKFGQITRFHFSDINTHPQFASRFFVFEAPDNIDVYSR